MVRGPAGASRRAWWPWSVPALLAAVLVALAARCGGGVAGTDEFWYVGDVRMTAATGRAVTNHVYPLYAQAAAPGALPPRMHDAPVTDLVVLVARLTDLSPGAAWLSTNVGLILLTALLVGLAARAAGGVGALGAAAFLAFPSTAWAAISPLAEASLACGTAVVAAAGVAAQRTHRARWWAVAGAAAGLLAWTRPNALFVLVALLAWTSWRAWRGARRHGGWRAPVAVGAAGGAVLVAHALAGAGYPNGGFGATLMVGAAGAASNMDLYSVPVPFDFGAFLAKAARGMGRALTPRTGPEFALVLPIVAACAAGLAARRGEPGERRAGARRFLGVLAVALLGGYVVTCGVFQPQTRYLYAAAPVAAMLLDVGLTAWWSRGRSGVRLAVGSLVLLLGCVGAARSVDVARTLQVAQAGAEQRTARLAAALAPHLGPGRDAVLVVAHGNAADLAVAYAAVPHATLSVDPAVIPAGQATELARAWGVGAVVFAPADAGYVRGLGPVGAPTDAGSWRVQRVGRHR